MRGNAKDYDNWAAMGNSGWSFKDVLPYFKKLEDMKHEKLINGKYISAYLIIRLMYILAIKICILKIG